MKLILILFICLAAGSLKAQSISATLRPIRMVSSRRHTWFYMDNNRVSMKDVRQQLNLFPGSAGELQRSDVCSKSSMWNAGIFLVSDIALRVTYKPWYNNPQLHQLDRGLLFTACGSLVGWYISSALYNVHLRRAINLYNKNISLARVVAAP